MTSEKKKTSGKIQIWCNDSHQIVSKTTLTDQGIHVYAVIDCNNRCWKTIIKVTLQK